MYSQDAIDKLTDRIGWDNAIPLPNGQPTAITLDANVTRSDSGRVFSAFHNLVTAENMIMAMDIPNIALTANPDNTRLNAYLLQLKQQAVLTVLNRVFDSNTAARDVNGSLIDTLTTDYSEIILTKTAAFDNAYGYQLAYDVLTLFLNSTRINGTVQAIAEKTYISASRDGVKTLEGRVMVPGVFQKLEDAYSSLNAVMFPAYTSKPTAKFISM